MVPACGIIPPKLKLHPNSFSGESDIETTHYRYLGLEFFISIQPLILMVSSRSDLSMIVNDPVETLSSMFAPMMRSDAAIDVLGALRRFKMPTSIIEAPSLNC